MVLVAFVISGPDVNESTQLHLAFESIHIDITESVFRIVIQGIPDVRIQ